MKLVRFDTNCRIVINTVIKVNVICIQNLAHLLVCFLTLFCSFFFLHQRRNGHHERIDFLTSKEKASSRRKTGIIIGVLVAFLILAAVAAFLIWLFVCEYNKKTSHRYVIHIRDFEVQHWAFICLDKLGDVGHSLDIFKYKSRSLLIELSEKFRVFTLLSPDSVKWITSTCCEGTALSYTFKSGLFGLCNFPLVFAFLTAPAFSFTKAK